MNPPDRRESAGQSAAPQRTGLLGHLRWERSMPRDSYDARRMALDLMSEVDIPRQSLPLVRWHLMAAYMAGLEDAIKLAQSGWEAKILGECSAVHGRRKFRDRQTKENR